ncbi:hypothetical protein [Olivibacter sp. XZL3]|uniref:hypothetical protein n=1 Tax=Olivibacter sp. XZL3 TaxID=1735116 RepID=UPI00141702F6|nr:hypothetical protein [Olivibacter sp. XZL3]
MAYKRGFSFGTTESKLHIYIFLTDLFRSGEYFCAMLHFFRGTAFRYVFSSLLIALFALKTAGIVFTYHTSKDASAFKAYEDNEKREKGERKDAGDRYKSNDFLQVDVIHNVGLIEKDLVRKRSLGAFFYHFCHIDAVPSPPPDKIV